MSKIGVKNLFSQGDWHEMSVNMVNEDNHYDSCPNILYTESSPLIVYGPTTQTQKEIVLTYSSDDEDSLPTPTITHQGNQRTRVRRASRSTPPTQTDDRLLQLATSVVMVTGGNFDFDVSQPTQEPTRTRNIDDSESQTPTSFPTPPNDTASVTQLPTELLPDSETQPPVVFPEPPKNNRTPPSSPSQLLEASKDNCTTPSLAPRTIAPPSPLPKFWSDCNDIYPTVREIAEALQDPGKERTKVVNGTKQNVTTFPLLQKLCTKIYQQIQNIYKPQGLTKNTTRGREILASLVLMHRRHADAVDLDVFFHEFARKGKVYIITNNVVHCGLDIPIREFQATVVDQMVKSKATRTSNDGLRLALTLLDPKYREAVSLIMSNRKDRSHSDISGDYVLHLFEQILVESFQNPDYQPPIPARTLFGDITDQEIQQWDPNDPQLFEVTRNGSWLLETWKVYIRKKYKTALDKWNKDTGGGNGQPWSFVNFCDRDARWLVVVFIMDVQANYLLASNAGGRMPCHLQLECGKEGVPELSSLESSGSSGKSTNVHSRKASLLEAQQETKRLKTKLDTYMDKMDNCFDMFSTLCKERQETAMNAQREVFTHSGSVMDAISKVNQEVAVIENMRSMPAQSKEKYISILNARRDRLIDILSDLEEKEARET